MFLGGVPGIAAAYAIGAVYVGLGTQVGKAPLRSANSPVDGAVIALSPPAIGIVAILSRPVPSLGKIIAGAALTLPGMAALLLAGLSRALVLFIISAIVCGAAYSLLFAAGLALIGRTAPAGQRGAALSAGYLVAYAVQAATALGLGLGAVATVSGFQLAADIALPIILALALVAASLAVAGRRDLRPMQAPGAPTGSREQPVEPAGRKSH